MGWTGEVAIFLCPKAITMTRLRCCARWNVLFSVQIEAVREGCIPDATLVPRHILAPSSLWPAFSFSPPGSQEHVVFVLCRLAGGATTTAGLTHDCAYSKAPGDVHTESMHATYNNHAGSHWLGPRCLTSVFRPSSVLGNSWWLLLFIPLPSFPLLLSNPGCQERGRAGERERTIDIARISIKKKRP